jgi:hypothetical protein
VSVDLGSRSVDFEDGFVELRKRSARLHGPLGTGSYTLLLIILADVDRHIRLEDVVGALQRLQLLK